MIQNKQQKKKMNKKTFKIKVYSTNLDSELQTKMWLKTEYCDLQNLQINLQYKID